MMSDVCRSVRNLGQLSLAVLVSGLMLSGTAAAKGFGNDPWDDPASYFFPGYDTNHDGHLYRKVSVVGTFGTDVVVI